MKLTLKIALLISFVMAVALLGVEALTLSRESSLLEDDLQRDARLVAHTLAEAAAETEQPSRLVEKVGRDEAELRMAWRSIASPEVPESARDSIEAGHTVVQNIKDGGDVWVVAWAPVIRHEALLGIVEVREPLAVRNAFIVRGMRTALVTISGVTFLSGLVSILFGRVLVGRRVDLLVEKTREVARGELRGVVDIPGGDELTLLGAALNRMSADLAFLRQSAEAEARARLDAEVALQHADRLRTLGVLSAGVGHELGTPLNIISGRAGLIARRSSDEKVLSDVIIIKDQVARISHLVRRMMDYSRVSQPNVSAVDLADLARETVGLLEPEARKFGADIVVKAPPAGVPVTVDPGQMRQVVTNLVLNAVHVSGEGQVVEVLLEPTSRGGALLVVVDQGPGVSKENRERVFEPFFTTKAPGDGTGLGLSIVRRIVEDHGGTIQIDDAPSGGAAFCVYLPALEEP